MIHDNQPLTIKEGKGKMKKQLEQRVHSGCRKDSYYREVPVHATVLEVTRSTPRAAL